MTFEERLADAIKEVIIRDIERYHIWMCRN